MKGRLNYQLENNAKSRPEKFNRLWYKFAIELLFPNTKILDVGCGLGEFAKIASSEKKCTVSCIDGSGEYVSSLKKAGFNAEIVDLEVGSFPFENNFFDGAVALEVIEHIRSPDKMLREINRVLKPTGYLILSTPNVVWFRHRISGLFGRPPHEEGYHFRFFTQKKLEKLLEDNGFIIEKWNSYAFNRKISFWQSLFAYGFVLRARKNMVK